MRGWELLKLALEGVRRTPLRLILTSLGVAIATGALVAMIAFAQGLQAQAERPFEDLEWFNRIDVFLERPGGRGEGPPARGEAGPRGRGKGKRTDAAVGEGVPAVPPAGILDDAALVKFRAIPGVVLAYPDVTKGGIEIVAGEVALQALATSLPREASQMPFAKTLLKAGRPFASGEAKEIWIGATLAKELGFDPPEKALGVEVTLRASGLVPALPLGFRWETTEMPIAVAGISEAPGLFGERLGSRWMVLPTDVIVALPGATVDATIAAMRRGNLEPEPGYQNAIVRTARADDVPEVEASLRALGYQTRALASQMDSLKTFFIVLDVLLGAVGTVALVVAGLGIVNTLLMSVLERYREIGTWKAIGASDGDVRILFLAEAALVGLLGGAGGLALGRLVAAAIGVGVGIYARSKGVEQEIAIFAFPAWLMAGAVAFAVLASVASGVYPASRAAKIDPIRALRGE